ncbi:uncharacterized protein LOC106068359 [Biomphalaria glabrata]|uniref:Uncharacterized protein LOC106068359 n=1 Tax=Biomphalaria glabrata TaxID=6526 RepID=A0A9W3BBA5_BIOGL|nr:uncharacterized protein LOC106068359 [Biomphalaria glabrata]
MDSSDTSAVSRRKPGLMPLDDYVAPPHYDPAIIELEKAIDLAEKSGVIPELVESLKRTRELIGQRDEFTVFCTSSESPTCKDIYDKTCTHDWRKVFDEGRTTWNLSPVMMTGQLEGQFLKSIVSIQKAKKILDIGMFTGYSALSLAEALPEDGEMWTIDFDEYLKTFVQNITQSSPHGQKIKYLIGNALEILEKLRQDGQIFDIVFLDAAKVEYKDYLEYAFEKNLLAPRGTVLVDNSYQFGESYSEEETISKKFAKRVAFDTSLHSVLVPIRDGIMVIRRVVDVEGGVTESSN